jgi:pyruvate dehydrogenase E1 component alpha subunit/2-oxoisovalerate dehydrogenase E1 component alpha subunit
VDKAVGYGMTGHSVDGTDLEKCLRILSDAVSTARAGGGPQLVVASLLRLAGHGEHDDAHYIEENLRESRLGADCLMLAEARLLAEGWADADAVREMQEDAERQVEDAVTTTLREPLPDPNKEDWCPLASRHLSEGFSPA